MWFGSHLEKIAFLVVFLLSSLLKIMLDMIKNNPKKQIWACSLNNSLFFRDLGE